MLYSDYENIEGQLAFQQALNAFAGRVLARLRGDAEHLLSHA